MTYVIMNVVLYTLVPDNTLEILETKIPTMHGLDGKIDQITTIISNWATAILVMRLRKEGEILTCQVRVVENANISIYIDIMLNGQHLEILPTEYIIEFDRGMPELVKEIYNVLRLNFKVGFTATNYIASDIYESMKQRMPALEASYTLPEQHGWYRIAYSWYGTGSCTGMVSFVTDTEDVSETGVFTVATSCGQDGNTIQQIQRSRKGIYAHITKARLVVNKRSYFEERAYIDIYKDSDKKQQIKILIADGRGMFMPDEPEYIESVPSGFETYEITFTDGGLTADRIKGVTVKPEEINQLAGIKGNVQTQINAKANTKHSSTETTYGTSSDTEYGHALASSTLPSVASGEGLLGTETTKFARGDHVHPVQTEVKYAEELKNARKITLSGAASGGTDTFTFSSDVPLKVNTLSATALTGKVPVSSMPSLEEYGAEPAFAKQTAFNKKFETDVSVLKKPGDASVGSSENIARADHVHPAQTTIEGKAKSAEKLETARTIAIAGSVNGAATAFDGTKNISITATTLKAEALTGTGNISITGNAHTATNLATGRMIALSGGAISSGTLFDGSASITLPVTSLDATTLTNTVPLSSMPTLSAYGAVAVAQGAENANKYLVVGTDGNVTTSNVIGIVVNTYAELEEALQETQNKDIILGKDLVANKDILTMGNNTVCLNGHTISSDSSEHRFLIINNNITLCGPGNIVGFKNNANGGCLKIADATKTCTVRNITFKGCSTTGEDGGCIYISEGTCVLENCIIRDTTSSLSGGGIFVNKGRCILYNTELANCHGTNELSLGGGISLNNANSEVTIYDGYIHDCYGLNGGGIYIYAGNCTINGGRIMNCYSKYASYGGGGIYICSGGTLTVSSAAYVLHNYNAGETDNIYNDGGTFTINTTLTGNVSLYTDTITTGQQLGTCTADAKYAFNIVNDKGTHHGKVDTTDNTKLIWESNT